MGDGNFIIYFSDGSITHSNNRRGEWQTINPIGVKRVRRIKDGVISDEMNKLNIQTKIDPETNATLKIREDGVLNIEYIDQSHLIIMPDGTNILKKKDQMTRQEVLLSSQRKDLFQLDKSMIQ